MRYNTIRTQILEEYSSQSTTIIGKSFFKTVALKGERVIKLITCHVPEGEMRERERERESVCDKEVIHNRSL